MDDLERIKRELERQKRDRAQALAQRAKLERRTDPPGTLLGFDRATGQPLVAQGAGIIPMRSLSNIGAIGDVGRAAAGGFDVGNRRSQQQFVHKSIQVTGQCELPGILFFRQTKQGGFTYTYVYGPFLIEIENGLIDRFFTKDTIVHPGGINELIWCPNRGANQVLFQENIPEQSEVFYSGGTFLSRFYLLPFVRYEPWTVNDAIFWAESKQSGEVAVTFQKGSGPGSAVRDVIYQLSEFGASELSSHDYVMPSFGTPVRTYRGNNTIDLSSNIELFILRSSPPITLSTDTSSSGYTQSVEDGNTRYPVTFLDLQTNTVVHTSVSSVYGASQNLPILFGNHLMQINLKFSDDYYSHSFGFTMDGKIAALAYLNVYTKTGNEYRGEDPDVLFQLPTDLKISGLGRFSPPPSFPFSFVSSDNYFYMPSGIQIDRVLSAVGYSNNVIILGSYFYPKNDCKLTYSTLVKQDLNKLPPDSGLDPF